MSCSVHQDLASLRDSVSALLAAYRELLAVRGKILNQEISAVQGLELIRSALVK